MADFGEIAVNVLNLILYRNPKESVQVRDLTHPRVQLTEYMLFTVLRVRTLEEYLAPADNLLIGFILEQRIIGLRCHMDYEPVYSNTPTKYVL